MVWVLSTSQVLELSAEERQASREALKGLLNNIYQPIVIQQLLLLQNGPKKVSIYLQHYATCEFRDGTDASRYRVVLLMPILRFSRICGMPGILGIVYIK